MVWAAAELASDAARWFDSGTAGYIKVWSGSTWALKPVKVWNGVSWVVKPMKFYNGSTFVDA